MSDETLSGQIVRLRMAFNAAATGDYAHPSQAGMFINGGPNLTLDSRLQAYNLLPLPFLADSIDLSNEQIAQNLDFLKLTTFFGRAVCNNSSFWTIEINDDQEHSNFLFVRANSGINAATQILSAGNTAKENPALLERIYSADQTFQSLRQDFDMRNKRRVSGQTSYSTEEKPDLPPDISAEASFLSLRQKQMKNALAHVEVLRDLALIFLKRMQFVTQDIFSLDSDNPEWRQNWNADTNAACHNGMALLKDAETILTYHAARHSAFPQRLAEAQRGLTAPHLH